MSEFHPDAECGCGHAGREHRPAAVAPFGRGLCWRSGCGCRALNVPGIPTPRPRYQHEPGCRYALVVHRGRARRRGEFRAPELVSTVPTVSQDVAWTVGHSLVEYDDGRPPSVYVDWIGGALHGASSDMVRIAGCGCGRRIHVFGTTGVVAELGPVLRWVIEHTAPQDWCELVPVPAGR